MVVTQLETDLLGGMVRRPWRLDEIVNFVQQHYDGGDEASALALVARWKDHGWLERLAVPAGAGLGR